MLSQKGTWKRDNWSQYYSQVLIWCGKKNEPHIGPYYKSKPQLKSNLSEILPVNCKFVILLQLKQLKTWGRLTFSTKNKGLNTDKLTINWQNFARIRLQLKFAFIIRLIVIWIISKSFKENRNFIDGFDNTTSCLVMFLKSNKPSRRILKIRKTFINKYRSNVKLTFLDPLAE